MLETNAALKRLIAVCCKVFIILCFGFVTNSSKLYNSKYCNYDFEVRRKYDDYFNVGPIPTKFSFNASSQSTKNTTL